MRAIRTIIRVWLLSQLFQLGSWRELSQIDGHLMSFLQIRYVWARFSPQPNRFRKKRHGVALW